MQRALRIWDLQVIDSELERLRVELADIESRLGETDDLVQARRLAEDQSTTVHTLEAEQRSLDWDAENLRQKIKELETKLYSGKVTLFKEMQDYQQDIESLKRRLGTLEDREIDAIDRLETAEGEQKRGRSALAEVEESWRSDQTHLASRRLEIQNRIAAQETSRTNAIQLVHPADLARYEGLMRRKQNRAAASINRTFCGACRVDLPNAVVHEARSSPEPVICPSCERILVPS